MKISQIPEHMGIAAAQLADLMDVTKQALNNYTSGRKGKESKFLSHLLDVANLCREEVIFPDVFDHPGGETPTHPAYWLNVAIEALREAGKRGVECDDLIRIIFDRGEPTLQEIYPPE